MKDIKSKNESRAYCFVDATKSVEALTDEVCALILSK